VELVEMVDALVTISAAVIHLLAAVEAAEAVTEPLAMLVIAEMLVPMEIVEVQEILAALAELVQQETVVAVVMQHNLVT
jgi:hypothetical protein